ncbi:MAG: hypothetical protein IBX40_10250 [Methanosarcinales archaeon]|nr:hypothetical protein [Methanosarcinales archaeon]
MLSFKDPIPFNIGSIITSITEATKINFDPKKIVTYEKDPNSTINAALRILKGKTWIGQIVIGIDPGKNPGIAVLEDGQVVEVHHVTAREVTNVILQILEEYPNENTIIKIGNGARLVRTQLINSLHDLNIPIEVVDETGTSPSMGRGLHSSEVSDIIAAINIAKLTGIVVGKQEVEPSMGEIKRIQEYSREHSNGKASIPRDLARKVAKGELTIEEAIEIHQNPLQV